MRFHLRPASYADDLVVMRDDCFPVDGFRDMCFALIRCVHNPAANDLDDATVVSSPVDDDLARIVVGIDVQSTCSKSSHSSADSSTPIHDAITA